MKVLHGTTRVVLLTTKYAFKFPTYVSWKLFLHGLLANMQENLFSGLHSNLCPVLFYIPGGFLTVMPACTPLTTEEYESLDFIRFVDQEDMELPVENKQDSFGWLNGRIVAIDYGS